VKEQLAMTADLNYITQ